MDVDVTVARERDLAKCRHQCVISTVACRLEYDNIRVGRTDYLKYCVEARILFHQLLTYAKSIDTQESFNSAADSR